MSTTTSFGYKKPQDGDRGATWFDDLEFNIDRVNSHDHDGVDSTKLSPTSLTKTTQTVSSASWGSATNGIYSQTVTVPAGFTVDDYIFVFRDNSSGHQLMLEWEKASSTTFNLFINDNTVTVKVIYG